MIFIYIRQLKHRAAQKEGTLRLQSLQGQMNPHFIFNSLNSINYFISKNDALSANRYIADFSKLIRSILYNFNSDYINLEKEIESLEEYLKIEHLRFGDKFNYEIIINADIEPNQYKVSPGLVQPFIENAIWHGVRGLDKRKGNILVSYTIDNGKLTCTIEDDGIGRRNAEAAKSGIDQKESRGIFIVTERLKIINNLQKSNYQVIISDLYPGKQETGTKVMIDIPVKKN
jgi:LytS/YehU family sensor histidine kinase